MSPRAAVKSGPLLSLFAEIQELRHASTQATQLDSRLSALDARVSDLSNRIDKALADLARRHDGTLEADLRLELESEWGKFLSARALLKEEVKEDGWLVRFRAYVCPLQPQVSALIIENGGPGGSHDAASAEQLGGVSGTPT